MRCTLWPKDALHAPESLLPSAAAPPQWPESGAGLIGELGRGRIRLSWQRARSGTGSAADQAELYGYELLRGEGERAAPELPHYASVRATTPAFLDTNLLSGQTYTYAVQAYDRRGVRGPRSAPLQLTLPGDDCDELAAVTAEPH